jgi:hypothetical protein
VKEDTSGRKSSLTGGKTQVSKDPKSTSLAKNHIGNSLGNKTPMNNNLVGPPPPLQSNKTTTSKRGIGIEHPYEGQR